MLLGENITNFVTVFCKFQSLEPKKLSLTAEDAEDAEEFNLYSSVEPQRTQRTRRNSKAYMTFGVHPKGA